MVEVLEQRSQIDRLKEIALDLGLNVFVEDLSGIIGCTIESIKWSGKILTIKLRDENRNTLYNLMLINTSKGEIMLINAAKTIKSIQRTELK
jgi:hypothetical protein